MAMMNNLDFDYTFSMDYRDALLPMSGDDIAPIWNYEEQNFPLSTSIGDMGFMYGTEHFMFPERLGVSYTTDVAETLMPGFTGECGFSGFDQNFRSDGYEFVSDFQPVYGGSDAWGGQSQCNSLASAEEPNVKVRRYTEEERKHRIMRYLDKRNRRNFNKTIKYACRKTLADRRIRVRGRFARNNDVSQESKEATDNSGHHDKEEYYDEDAEIKHSGEEWLEEAVASLMYMPIFGG